MSPGAKVGVFVVILLAVGAGIFFGWRFVSDNLLGAGPGLPPEVVAGETFKPGATVDLYGSQTTAVLDGVTQKVQASTPTQEWKDNLQEVTCDPAGECTALAPASAKAGGEGKGGFLGTGYTIGGLAGLLLVGYILYVLFVEEDK